MNPEQREPGTLEYPAIEVLGVLQGVRGEHQSVTAAPRFLAGVVQREEFFETSPARVGGAERRGSALRTGVSHAGEIRQCPALDLP